MTDPLTMLEDLEAMKRSLPRGSHMNPNVIDSFLVVLADAIMPGRTGLRMDYRLQSVRAAILGRLAKVYAIPFRTLVWDFTIVVDREMLSREREELQHLEDAYNL